MGMRRDTALNGRDLEDSFPVEEWRGTECRTEKREGKRLCPAGIPIVAREDLGRLLPSREGRLEGVCW